jgi:PASTA domain
MPDLSESIRTLMREGGEPIAFSEITSRPAPRRSWFTAFSETRNAPSTLRLPAFAWAGVLALVIVSVVVFSVTLSGSPSSSKLPPTKGGTGTLHVLFTVPNVLGMKSGQATTVLRSAGFAVTVSQSTLNPALSAKVVELQQPSAGVRAQRGSVVEIYVTPPVATTDPSSLLPASLFPTGVFVNGTVGTPQYFITLVAKGGYQFSGSVNFLYQDGQTSVVFTFDGTGFGGAATIRPTADPGAGSDLQTSGTLPASITASYAKDAIGWIDLHSCNAFLHFINAATQCNFESTTSGLGAPAPAIPGGTYADGSANASRYYVVLSDRGVNLVGTVVYVDGDGRTATAFTFEGSAVESVAIVRVTANGTTAPSYISIGLGNHQFELGECFTYLSHIHSNAQCEFNFSSGGSG